VKPITTETQGLLSVRQVAVRLGLSPHTVYTMVSQRRIPYVKVGRLVKFDRAQVEAWLNQTTFMPMPERKH
jgi:excisionase family DNA binding protein